MIKEVATFAAEELAPKGAELIAEVLPKIAGKAGLATEARPAVTAAESALPKLEIKPFSDFSRYKSNAEGQKLLQDLFHDPLRHENLLPQFTGGATKFVDQWRYGVAPLSTPLETNGLYACTGLAVADRSAALHYLAHIDGDTSVVDIVNSLKQFDLGNSSVRVLPGPKFFAGAPSVRAGAAINVEKTVSALQQMPNGLKDFKFLRSTESGDYYSIVSHEGKLYRGAPTPY